MKNQIYRVLVYFISYTLFINNCLAQTPVTIYTPKGSVVPDTYSYTELSQSQIASYNSYISQTYPNATRLTDASATYNCHAYAWYTSEGGSNVWIGASTSTAEDIFWTDGSFTENVTQVYPAKVSYASDNHSATTTSQTDIFISKWGALPLMQHNKNYCPYNSSSLKYYYKTPTIITGSSQIICGQGTYSIQLPAGNNVSWTSSPSGIISHPATGNPITVTKIGNGNVTLTATINSSHVLTKNIWVGPHTTINGIETMLKGRTRTYTLNDVNGQGITSFNWSADGGVIPVGSTTSSSFTVKGTGCGSGTVSCTYGNSCGTGDAQLDIEVICETLSMILSPNPTSDIININLVSAFDQTVVANDNNLLAESYATKQENNQYTGEFEIQVWNEYSGFITKIKDKNKPNLQISIKNKPKGMYYVHLIVDGIVVQKKTLFLTE